jgi:hypothetical protein
MENVATYSEARSEYTKQLATFIVPPVVGWFQTLWSRNASDRQRCLSAFQGECEEVSRWNQDRIHDEVRVLLERSGCDYMEELMTAVFVAHTKVLTAVRLSTKQKKLSITVPKLDHFIHRVFRESARCFWKTPFLFMSDGGVVERQKNLLQIELLATEAITTAVRGLLPVKQILHDYLGEDEEEIEEVKETVEVKPVVASEVVEEKVEEKVAPTPVPEVVTEVKSDVKEIGPPAVVSIDTEPTVHFSDYDSVFDEAKGEPQIRYAPKEGEGEGEDEDEEDAHSDALTVDESSAVPLSADDVEDLEAPAPAPVPVVKKEEIDDSEVVVLE